MIPPPPRSTLFPYTTLFRSANENMVADKRFAHELAQNGRLQTKLKIAGNLFERVPNVILVFEQFGVSRVLDRKSTRLNSSHLGISYAVFCLKKKKKKTKKIT